MNRPHLTKLRGEWVVLIRPGASDVFLAMRWCDWMNGRHAWYYDRERRVVQARCHSAKVLLKP